MPSLETLQTKRAQLDAQIKRIRAREAHKSRAQDTRKKIIAGAIFLKWTQSDRALFDKMLAAVPEKEKKLFADGYARTLEAVQELREGKGTRYESLEAMKADFNA
jgi:Tfp pilus assembly protein PilN